MKYSYYIIIGILSFGVISCKKDFLEVADKTVLLKQAYVLDLETTGQYLTGVYGGLVEDYFYGTAFPYAEIIADNMKPVIGGRYFISEYNWSQRASALYKDNSNTLWQKLYGMAHDCSFVIEKAELYRSENAETADYYKGQAYALRALIHFILVNTFSQSYNFTPGGVHAGVPYITSSDLQVPVSRKTVNDTYKGLIDDLTTAITLLHPDNKIKELMNYHAAKALLARVLLFKEDFNGARQISLEVLNDMPLMINAYPTDLFATQDAEALFRFPPGVSEATKYSGIFIGYFAHPAYELTYLATADIAELLQEDPADKRYNWVNDTILAPNTPVVWLITKFPESATGLFPVPMGDHYHTVIRTSEIALTAAEAYAQMNNADSARFWLDKIRLRANPTAISTSASGNELLELIYKERRKELAFEGLRMFDLLRWKKGVNRTDANDVNAQTLPYPSGKAIAPIPLQDVTGSGLAQNPEY